MSRFHNLDGSFIVQSDTCRYQNDAIVSDYTYVLPVHGMLFFGHGFTLSLSCLVSFTLATDIRRL